MPKTMINGVGISYDVSGSGDPLVMIMGLGGNRSTWRFQVPVFEKYYRVITFDNRGVGDSDKPKGPYSIRQMADDALGLMDHLGIARSHILGASLGGTIAQELAINYPDRVSKLILACTYPCHDGTNGRTPEWADAINAFIRYRKTPSITLVANSWPYRILGFFMLRNQYGRMDEAAREGFIAQNEAA